MKLCKTCEQLLTEDSFYLVRKTSDKRLSKCKQCISAANRLYNVENNERRRQYYRNRWETINARRQESFKDPRNKIRNLLWAAKHRAKARGIPFDLSVEDIVIPTHCKYLGTPLVYGHAGGHQRDSATLDRIVPELGYVKGNVQIISHLANGMKQDATMEQLRTFARAILEE